MRNFKVGANNTDIRHIRRMAGEGANAQEIATALRLPLACVQSFMPEQPKPKRKAAPKAKVEPDAGGE